MSDLAQALLKKLLRGAERGARRTPLVPLTQGRAPEYFAADPGQRERAHAVLENAEAAGAVRLEWGRYEAARDLRRIRLVDADRLAEFLGEERAADKAARIARLAQPLLEGAPGWLAGALAYGLTRWGRGESAFGCPADEAETIGQVFRAVAAIARGEQEGLDLRRFSARLLGDSKALERLQPRIANLLRRDPALADMDSNLDLFRALGLEKFPPPLFLKGALRVRTAEAWLDLGVFRPYVALSPDAVHEVAVVREPGYLLSIENLASFQRHVRELDDNGLVLYTAGFPSPALRAFLAHLDRLLAPDTPFCHWGDVDLGGARIFAGLGAVLRHRSLRPHLMDGVAETGGKAFSSTERAGLEHLARDHGPAADLVRGWLQRGVGPLEQEQVDPGSPLGP